MYFYNLLFYSRITQEIHYKSYTSYERWSEYDAKGNKIHYKDCDGDEYWHEYDSKGNRVYSRDQDGYEKLYEYTYHPNGKVKTIRLFKPI